MNPSYSIRLTLLTGILLPLSFAPLPLGFLAHIGFLPLFLCLDQRDPKTSFRKGAGDPLSEERILPGDGSFPMPEESALTLTDDRRSWLKTYFFSSLLGRVC